MIVNLRVRLNLQDRVIIIQLPVSSAKEPPFSHGDHSKPGADDHPCFCSITGKEELSSS